MSACTALPSQKKNCFEYITKFIKIIIGLQGGGGLPELKALRVGKYKLALLVVGEACYAGLGKGCNKGS